LLKYRTPTASKYIYVSVSNFVIELILGSIEQTFAGMLVKPESFGSRSYISKYATMFSTDITVSTIDPNIGKQVQYLDLRDSLVSLPFSYSGK
jgi:hypothetical protein